MDFLDKIRGSLGSLFGADDMPALRRRLYAEIEACREEGLDGRVYVPNQYLLEIDARDEEEKEFLLSFLDRSELEEIVRRYCEENQYTIRGALDCAIREVSPQERERAPRERVRILCRYAARRPRSMSEPSPSPIVSPEPIPMEERTVASPHLPGAEEGGTVPSPAGGALIIYTPGRPASQYLIARGSVTIGRASKAHNDLILEGDSQVSKRHARIELDPDGRYTLYDLNSTNGVKVNGRRVENCTLQHGDEILLGATRLIFQQASAESEPVMVGAPERPHGGSMGAFGSPLRPEPRAAPPARPLRVRNARLALLREGEEIEEFLLASETSIGRGVTNDIVLPDRSVAMRHARILYDGQRYALETLNREAMTLLNGTPVVATHPVLLQHDDRIVLGNQQLRFDAGH
jgi:pSer/pThr/pTyr-binding forkhead associated (FHA) protein